MANNPISRYPLQWPLGWKRTPEEERQRGAFRRMAQTSSWRHSAKLTVHQAMQRLKDSLRHMGVPLDDLVVSTNLPTRLDGYPRSDANKPRDPGAAVYWLTPKGGASRCLAIDLYDEVEQNVAALAATLDALRLIERHGGAAVLERAFMGFAALPAPGQAEGPVVWHEVLGVPPAASLIEARTAWRRLAQELHPDRHGGQDPGGRMAAVNAAWLEAQRACE